jgi:hypothetical protein
MVGEMEKPLVIGKAAKPRCFKNMKINTLTVILRNNKKVWMTAATMAEWLNMLSQVKKKLHPQQALEAYRVVRC